MTVKIKEVVLHVVTAFHIVSGNPACDGVSHLRIIVVESARARDSAVSSAAFAAAVVQGEDRLRRTLDLGFLGSLVKWF